MHMDPKLSVNQKRNLPQSVCGCKRMYAKPIPIQETFVVLEPRYFVEMIGFHCLHLRKYNPKFPRKFHECPIPGSIPTTPTPTLTRSLSQSNNNVAFSRAQVGGSQNQSNLDSTPKPLGAGQARQARRDNTSPPVPLVRALSNDQNTSASGKSIALLSNSVWLLRACYCRKRESDRGEGEAEHQ
jgi:hypothetical protein